MFLLNRESKPIVWLVLYWASQWLLAAGLLLFLNAGWAGWRIRYYASPLDFPLIVVYGWLGMLTLWPGAYFVFARSAWWRRGMLALAMVLSLNALIWILTYKETPGYFGEHSFFIWLPFLSSTIVWWLMTLLGRWRLVQVTEDETVQVASPLSLRDLFLAITLLAFCIVPIQNMVVTWQRNPGPFPDKFLMHVAAAAAALLVPPMTLATAGILRIALRERPPSRAIVALLVVLLISWIGLLLCNLPRDIAGQVHLAAIYLAWSLGAIAHTCWLGYSLRTLGYRIRSRSWWART